ncbi:MAG: SpoIIE family protein phosphatase, partial [Myxococcales bacterium]|nr:SpoIIE family protein phosphatase [Myxococcales bacterium]
VNFPLKNVVVRALGLHDQVQVDVLQEHYRVGDVFLMCSDGLCGMIKDSLILELILKYDRLDSCCSKLIDAANEAGGNDNITALIIRVEKL